jgi:penicillin-binding protein 1C
MGVIFYALPKLEIPKCSPILLDRSGDVLCVQLTPDEKWRLPIRVDEVPPLYLKMLIAYEDKRFYQHPGVDLLALMRAFGQWIKHGKIISGGSTLTMQTVRLIRPRPRTLLYKIEEIFQAIRLEWLYSKQEILTIFLTLAPYGGNIEGLRAATLAYCQQNPNQLTPSQMALMVVIPQLPTSLRPHIHPTLAKKYRDKVLRRLEVTGILTKTQCLEAIDDSLPTQRFLFPQHAYHVLQQLRKQNPQQTIYQSTLIKKKQLALEKLLASEIIFFDTSQTAAALIIENGTRNIIAYVGSAAPFDDSKNGYVDMVQAVRSPGSALKPFIYALAFDENLIHPETLIEDVSTNFNGYMPTNFHDVFHGEITIKEALQQSLNIPVVMLLDKLGPGRFVDWLQSCGVKLTFSSKDILPSLPIALGGVGIRLVDLASLYCALANQGNYVPAVLQPHDQHGKQLALMQPASSWYVTRILEDAPAPSGIVDWYVTEKFPIAFKTGTSYGARDAWCVGYTYGSKGYTVGVWAGRADGSPSPNQLGRKTAAPILHKIFHTVVPLEQNFTNRFPPSGILDVSSRQLPDALRWFRKTSTRPFTLRVKTSQTLKFEFPVTDTTYTLQKKNHVASSYVPIPLKIKGGNPPYFLLINGEPTHVDFKEQGTALWYPNKVGFFEIAILDQNGQSSSVTIRLIE